MATKDKLVSLEVLKATTQADVNDLKSATEQTYNLVIGSMDGMTINQSGRMVAGTGTMLFYAPVTSGQYYTVKTNEASLVCGFIATLPTAGDYLYNNQRIIQSEMTIQATISGYLVCRATTPFTQYQIINGQTEKAYLPPLSAIDAIVRRATETTYNIISGTMTGMTINSSGRMISDSGYYLFYAPVANGTNYTVKTNDSSLVCGFTTSIPAAGDYLNARIIQPSKTIEATVDGYLVCRAITGYETPQIVEGGVDLAYQPVGYSAVDLVARYNAQLSAKWGAKTGCFFGDSLTQQGYYTSVLSGTYNITVNNYAVSGAAYVGTGTSDTGTIANQISGASSDCDFVFVLGGTNDWGLGKPLGTADTFTADDYSTLYNAVYNTLGLLRTKYPTKPIFVATIPQRNWQSTGQASGIMDNGNGVSVMQFNDAIKYVAGLYGCIVVDSFESGICVGNLDTYTSDNLHFNAVGGSRYATHIMDKMQTVTPY